MKKKDDIELEMQETVVEEPAVQEEVSMKDEAAEMKEQAKKTIQLIKQAQFLYDFENDSWR